jgi:iron complex transport system ATP-binding protein
VTVLEFVLSGRFAHGSAFGWETDQDLAAAETGLEVCELSEMRHRLMNQLSGGERQRVLLARALATEAGVLLLDEPTANLDLSHQALMFRLVKERTKECGGSAVVITHDLNLASEFADEILLLKNGEVAACGKPEEVLTGEVIRNVLGVEVILDSHPKTGNVRVTSVW